MAAQPRDGSILGVESLALGERIGCSKSPRDPKKSFDSVEAGRAAVARKARPKRDRQPFAAIQMQLTSAIEEPPQGPLFNCSSVY